MRFVRLGIITVAVLGLLALAQLDRGTKTKVQIAKSSESAAGRFAIPAAVGDAATDEAWYCPAARVRKGIESAHSIIVTNPTDSTISARLIPHALDTKQKAQPKSIKVEPQSVVTTSAADLGAGGEVAVTVEVLNGFASVEHRLTTEKGTEQGPCTNRTADHWYFPWSNTEKDATARLFVYNPLSVAAIVDVGTSTPESTNSPEALQGVIIAPNSVKELNVNASALRWERVGLVVTARTGLVAAELVQYFDEDNIAYNQKEGEGLNTATTSTTTKGETSKTDTRLIDETTGKPPFTRRGLAMVLGDIQTSHETVFMDGYTQNGVREWLYVMNVGDRTAAVEVYIEPLLPGEEPAEPLQKTILPGRVELVKLEGESRVPAGGFHRVRLVVPESSEVVGSLVHFVSEERAENASGQMRPASERGLTIDSGVPLMAKKWTVGVLDQSEGDEGWIFIDNPSDSSIALVTLTKVVAGTATPIAGIEGKELAPSEQLAVAIEPSAAAFVVSAETPVAVSYRWTDAETEDMSAAPAVPSGTSAEPIR